jgi:hypothetical protein
MHSHELMATSGIGGRRLLESTWDGLLGLLPSLCKLEQMWKVFGPVPERGRIKIGTVGPNEGGNFGIDADLSKEFGIAQGTVHPAVKNRGEIDRLPATVVKLDIQKMVAKLAKAGDADDGM